MELFGSECKDKLVEHVAGQANPLVAAGAAGDRYKPHFGCCGTPRLPIQPEVIMQQPTPTTEHVYHNKDFIIFPENVVDPLRGYFGYKANAQASLIDPRSPQPPDLSPFCLM